MIRYVDRQGQEITREEWHTLLCDPDYSILKVTCVGTRQYVETSWIGLEIEGDPGPGAFVLMTYTETIGLEPPAKFRRKVLGWYATQEEALAAHVGACAQQEKEVRHG